MYGRARTSSVPRLRNLRPDPLVDINPLDADARDIVARQWVELSTAKGALRVRANITEYVLPGVVNMSHSLPEANVNELIDNRYRDPISGYPGFKSLLCEVKGVQGDDS
jgi:anaerobic selenocysteine-containing dehydrogenase